VKRRTTNYINPHCSIQYDNGEREEERRYISPVQSWCRSRGGAGPEGRRN